MAFGCLLVGVQGFASEYLFTFQLDGAHNLPPTTSEGSAQGTLICDPSADTITIDMSYSSLSRIHEILGFWFTTTPGDFANYTGFAFNDYRVPLPMPGTFTTTRNYHGTMNEGLVGRLVDSMNAGRGYIKVTTDAFPNPRGEIGGYISVPEPSTLSMFICGLVAAQALWCPRYRRGAR